MPTPHNTAQPGEIAKIVLMPGDPLRAKLIAEAFLEDITCFNTVRNMFGYTGSYKGKQLSVMGSGMGVPSMGIYSYELYTEYEVENIIRIGSIGGIAEHVLLRDIIIAMGASTTSNYASQYKLPGTFAPTADYELLKTAKDTADELGIFAHVGNVVTSDTFYCDDASANDAWKKMGILGVEMETAGLYMNAARLGKKALAFFTVSDLVYTQESLSAQERQESFEDMMKIALETAYKIE
jgi:purine-nucleoside phosphorylase